MEDILEDINAVVGVTGCFVCDEEGEVLASALPGVFDETMLSVVGRTAAQTVAGLWAARRKKVGDMDLLYTEGRLIVKNLGRGCLCILCVPRINVPLLNLTAKVAARKLKEKPVSRKAKRPSGPIVDAAFFSRIEQELTKEMGPMAALIIDEKVAASGWDKDSFPRENAAELVEKVSAEIGNEERGLQFQRTMLEVLEGL
ncbi:MAG: roadblock/LC7 domain-containing protein [Chloroflexota bacterium]|nr:roadblock/LC7 domain-containing protein [Chloroflexota bacterium]